ncbi:MAG TPA: LuxR C-terminal-related transcriptional regulator [Verrucomicrobiae bacterium]|jgi:DNA-binding NarL/FixJ family response regulator
MPVRHENPGSYIANAIGYLSSEQCSFEPSKVNGKNEVIAQNNRFAQSEASIFKIKEVDSLSVREREVLEFLSDGYLIKEIASKMEISFDTARTYVRRIYEKMHVHSRAQAVAKYLRPVNLND